MALWGGLQNRLQHLWGHRPPHAYSGPASGHDYRTSQVHSSWNPINHFDLAETLRDTTPADLIRYAHRPPSLLYAQNEWRRAEYYQKLSLRLSSIKPEVGRLESLFLRRGLLLQVRALWMDGLRGRCVQFEALSSACTALETKRLKRKGGRPGNRRAGLLRGKLDPWRRWLHHAAILRRRWKAFAPLKTRER